VKAILNSITIVVAALMLRCPGFADLTPIPCAVGNRWEYDTVKLVRASIVFEGKTLSAFRETSYGTSVYEVTGADEKSSPTIYDYREETRTWSTSSHEPHFEVSDLKITAEDGAIRILSTKSRSSSETEPDEQSYNPPLLYYSIADALNLKSWEVGVMRERETGCSLSARAVGRETVTVPAGTFEDCLRVVYSGENVFGKMELWQKPFTITGGRSRGVYWIAEGIGVVKELEVATTTAEAEGPGGRKILLEAASCTVNELKPGYVVKK
jgi:hypothetical protein